MSNERDGEKLGPKLTSRQRSFDLIDLDWFELS